LSQRRILCIFGTRPEAIKFAPLIKEFQKHPDQFTVITCVTAQHRTMLDQVMDFFNLKAEYDLDAMTANQTLFDIVAKVMPGLHKVIEQSNPDLIIVQGDTTTAFLGALAGYYKNVPVAHLEAGLRSGNKAAPWPEEMNRTMISHLGDLHFAPTANAEINLKKENLHDHIYITGNTVIDALHLALDIIKENQLDFANEFPSIDFKKKLILVTAHRRESFGSPFENICDALAEIGKSHPDVQILYPVHLNPNVKGPVYDRLSGFPNIFLVEPVDYPRLIWLLNQCYCVVTDSGGIQEEAPALGKPVLVMRDVTERQEGVDAGTAMLVGTDRAVIVREVNRLLTNDAHYAAMHNAVNPYGDGTTSKQIVRILQRYFKLTDA
jgi:UDP-N-acetylglucosamine 2-epimerase (non-hydrolysing)